MSSAMGFTLYPPVSPKASAEGAQQPLRFGILGAAAIAPAALIRPALSHPDVVVHAVAARSLPRAQSYARTHSIPVAYGSYQELLDDESVDAVYVALPNGLHYEWTMKALARGKHVLLEKPAADREGEVRELVEEARRRGVVLLEAFHYRFHPAIIRVKEILDSGELGRVKHVDARMTLFKGYFPPSDIRFDFDLGGGAMMDMGCYTLNCIRYLTSSNPTSILSVSHKVFTPSGTSSTSGEGRVDTATTASFALPNDTTAQLTCDLAVPRILGVIPPLPELNIVVDCENGKVELFNFVLSSLYHTITVTEGKGKDARVKRREKRYTFAEEEGGNRNGVKGEPWWETYRYQLEAFVSKVRGREVHAWVDGEDSIENAKWIDKVYEQTMSPGLKRAREPYRIKNALVGLGLGAFAVGVWAYSISAVKQDVFDDVDEEARALGAGSGASASSPSVASTSTSTPASTSTTPTPALPAAAGFAQGTANIMLPGSELPLPPVSPPPTTSPSTTKGRGILQILDRKFPGKVLDPESKTLIWGAPNVDNIGRLGSRSS